MIDIAIVEDSPVLRRSLAEWIDATPDFKCVCSCGSTEEALVEIPRHQPAVVLMDIHLPGASGIVCTAKLKEHLPKVQIVMLTVYKNHKLIFQALKAGACGYLLKRASREVIIGSLKEVSSGGAPMTGEIARMLVEAFHTLPAASSEVENLSPRESEILQLLAEGLFNKEIADRLKISSATIRNHLHHIYEKLHVGCRTEAVKKFTDTVGIFNQKQ
jgi:DNA-binding NarL/FixJ family response regulator